MNCGHLVVDGRVEAPWSSEERSGPVADFLSAARPIDGADHATVVSARDGYRASIPLTDLVRGRLDNGRLTIPDGRTLCWNVKDVVRIEVTVGKQVDDVPEKPPH